MYTLDDLRGRYVRVGTPEAEIFLDACEDLGVVWYGSAGKPRDVSHTSKCIAVDSDDTITHCDESYYRDNCAYTPFTPEQLPLSELTDDQAATLFNAWSRGENIKGLLAGNWCRDGIYSVTTERDRFIEACQSGDFGAVYDEFIRD